MARREVLREAIEASGRSATGRVLRREIVRVLRAVVRGLQVARSFGPHARGDATPASDVDVAFLASEAIAPSRLRAVRQELERATGSDVHVVDPRTASIVFRHGIKQQGELHSVGARRSRASSTSCCATTFG